MTNTTNTNAATTPSNAELMAMIMDLKKTNEELQKKAIARITKGPSWKFMCKPNAKDGLFLQVSGVKNLSKEGKPYSPSLNIHNYQLGTFLEVLKSKQYREAAIQCIEKGKTTTL